MKNECGTLSNSVFTHHAERLLLDANLFLHDDYQIVFKFTKGWLERFKERYDLWFRRVHSEAMSAEDDAIRLVMSRLLQICSKNADSDVYN